MRDERSLVNFFWNLIKGDQLDISVNPKRIFDPILWVMNNSTGWFPFFFKVKTSFSNFIKKAQTSAKKETPASPPPVRREPINYRNVVKYGAGALILALIILFLYSPGILPKFLLPDFNLPQISGTTTTPTSAMNAKDLAMRSYGDFLQEGQTNTYYFDVSPNDITKYKLIKVFAQGRSGTIITSAVGINYVPSIENNKFDYTSSSSANIPYAVIEIDNPNTGRYYVIVKGVAGSGDTRVSISFY
jgi:hypothetical protein